MKETPQKEDVEYWRWQEYHRVFSEKKWKNKDVITAGVDVGSVGSKATIMIDGEVYSWGVMRTGSNSPDSAKKALDWAMEGTGLRLDDLKYIVGTGYGRVNVPMANKAITEIACHAKGANYIWGPRVRTVLDVGGQDIKAIRCDETGRVTSFLMNDKCAAGTGRGMEVFADLLKIPIEKIGEVCRERGIIFSVDAIQGVGAVRLDVEKCKIDFLSSGTQKWLLGLQGLAFIYVSKELQETMKSAPIGWLAVKDAWKLLDYELTAKETAERFQPGTLNNLGIYAFNESMKFFKEFGFDEIEEQILSNSKYFIEQLALIGYKSPLLSLPEKHLSGIVSFRNENAEKIFDHLSRKKIICSLREGYIRFAPHFYNTEQEINRVIEEMKKL